MIPAVEVGSGPAQSSWLGPAQSWYNDPARWDVFLAQSGPASWPRVPIGDPRPPRRRVPATRVTAGRGDRQHGSFHVSRIGHTGAGQGLLLSQLAGLGGHGPYRVTPNLMVVVPTAHTVVLHYGATSANRVGQGLPSSASPHCAALACGPPPGAEPDGDRKTRRKDDLSPAT